MHQVQNLNFGLLLLLTNTASARFCPLVISVVSSLPLVRFYSVPTVLLLAIRFLLGLYFISPHQIYSKVLFLPPDIFPLCFSRRRGLVCFSICTGPVLPLSIRAAC
jgi:hypothetical protein